MTARAIEGHIAGGRLAIDGTGTAYLSVGDYHWDGSFGPGSRPGTDPESNPPLAQDPAADYGKVIAIDLRRGQTRQMSRGHRNPQGIALDRRGNVWIVDQGMRGGDELNRIIDGENYGWPLESYGTLYSALPLPHTKSFGRHAVFRRPEMAWLPSIATSGLTRIEGFHEAWDGDLLASTLRGRMLARIRIADNRAVFSEFIEIGLRIRQVHQHGDGRIVLWTDDQQLIFLSPTSGGLGFKYANYRLDMMDADDATVRKVRAALQGCMECHSLNKGENVTAPSLAEVYEAEIGSTAYKGYSVALQADGRRWNKALLAAYLADPQATVPGTNMPDPVIADSRVRQGIVDILEGLATEIEIPRRFRDR